jgi:dipeptidyl aminopeptidase/acylaminoacyl peptidase
MSGTREHAFGGGKHALGVRVGASPFPDEGHGAAKRENQVLQWGYALSFFEKHLR